MSIEGDARFRAEIARLRAALAEEEQDAEALRLEGARLRAQLAEVNLLVERRAEQILQERDEAQQEMERLKQTTLPKDCLCEICRRR